jgi:hypothetical protein
LEKWFLVKVPIPVVISKVPENLGRVGTVAQVLVLSNPWDLLGPHRPNRSPVDRRKRLAENILTKVPIRVIIC